MRENDGLLFVMVIMLVVAYGISWRSAAHVSALKTKLAETEVRVEANEQKDAKRDRWMREHQTDLMKQIEERAGRCAVD